MNDYINRQDAIDALQERYKLHDWDDDGEAKAECGAIIREIYALPSAQQWKSALTDKLHQLEMFNEDIPNWVWKVIEGM